jgi:UDP:flavonoid glycosyltransferase YjiC (YdhE family)
MMPHLLVALSAHGYGHLAQTAPVLDALRRRLPALRLTLYSALSRALLAQRIAGDFHYIGRAADVGMVMKDAMEVDTAASAEAYADFHHRWDEAVAEEAGLLTAHAPDAVLANAPYRILAAAAHCGIPALGLCSLNWSDLYAHFCSGQPGAAAILAQMRAAYGSARAFLRPAPSMPMTDLARGIAIGPIAALGRDRRGEILRRLALPETTRLVLVSLGGVPSRLDISDWPALPGVRWIVPAAWAPPRKDAVAFESLAMTFVDVLRSADALITKPGYGSFAEAACSGVPVLYAPRPDWPEQIYLEAWVQAHGHCRAIQRQQLERGGFAAELAALLAAPRPAPVAPTGIAEAVEHLATLLAGRAH